MMLLLLPMLLLDCAQTAVSNPSQNSPEVGTWVDVFCNYRHFRILTSGNMDVFVVLRGCNTDSSFSLFPSWRFPPHTHTHTHTHLFRSVKIKCSTRYEFMQMSAWCNWGKYRAAFKGVAKINCPLYTISQKTSYLYLAITLTCMNWFLSFLGADLLQIKLAIKTCFIASMLYLTKHINAKSHEFAWCARVHLVAA